MNEVSKEEMASIVASIEESSRRGNQILSYWHCSQCCDEELHPNIAVGWTPKGIQVWCETHDENVLHVDLCGNKVDIVSVERVA